jgi:prephenate dehydrogenase
MAKRGKATQIFKSDCNRAIAELEYMWRDYASSEHGISVRAIAELKALTERLRKWQAR